MPVDDLLADAKNNKEASRTAPLYSVRILEDLPASTNPESPSPTIESPSGFQIHLLQSACLETLVLALNAIRQSETLEAPSRC